MGAPGGAPVAADVDVLNGDAGHRVVEAVERGVMDYIKAHRDTLGAAGCSDEDLDDLFKSCIREAASRTMVWFTLVGGAASALHVVEAGTMRPIETGEADDGSRVPTARALYSVWRALRCHTCVRGQRRA